MAAKNRPRLIEKVKRTGIDRINVTHARCGYRINRVNRSRRVLGMIEDIEEISPELYGCLFRKIELAAQTQVNLVKGKPSEHIAPQIALLTCRWRAEWPLTARATRINGIIKPPAAGRIRIVKVKRNSLN